MLALILKLSLVLWFALTLALFSKLLRISSDLLMLVDFSVLVFSLATLLSEADLLALLSLVLRSTWLFTMSVLALVLACALCSVLVLRDLLISTWFDFSSAKRDFACGSVGFNCSKLADLLVDAAALSLFTLDKLVLKLSRFSTLVDTLVDALTLASLLTLKLLLSLSLALDAAFDSVMLRASVLRLTLKLS